MTSFGRLHLLISSLLICSVVFYLLDLGAASQELSRSVEGQEQQAKLLAQELNESLLYSGTISNITTKVSSCLLEVRTEYQRPCSDRLRGMFIVQRVELIDMRELVRNKNGITVSPFSTASKDIVHWAFSEEKLEAMRALNGRLRASADKYYEDGVDGNQRIKLLNLEAEELSTNLSLESRTYTHSCLLEPAISGFLSEAFVMKIKPSRTDDVVERINSYQHQYCLVDHN